MKHSRRLPFIPDGGRHRPTGRRTAGPATVRDVRTPVALRTFTFLLAARQPFGLSEEAISRSEGRTVLKEAYAPGVAMMIGVHTAYGAESSIITGRLKELRRASDKLTALFSSRDRPIHGVMEQLIVGALFIGSMIVTAAAARGMLGLLFHLMALGGQSDRLAAERRDPSPTL